MVYRGHVHDLQQRKRWYTDGMYMNFRSRNSAKSLMKFARVETQATVVIDTLAEPQHAVDLKIDTIHVSLIDWISDADDSSCASLHALSVRVQLALKTVLMLFACCF